MSKILDVATSHFREKLSAEMQSIVVPEWGDAKIFFRSVVTMKEQAKLIELATAGKTVEALVETLIVKARNDDGTKMFNMADKVILMNEVDPNVIIRVVGDINSLSSEEQDLEKIEKN